MVIANAARQSTTLPPQDLIVAGTSKRSTDRLQASHTGRWIAWDMYHENWTERDPYGSSSREVKPR